MEISTTKTKEIETAVVKPGGKTNMEIITTNPSWSEIKEIATAVAKSGLFPSIKTPEAALTLMMLCQAEGLHPVMALRRYHIFSGQISMKADAMLGEFMKRGGTIEWVKNSDTVVEAIFETPGLKKPVTVQWTIEDASRAKLTGKDNWKTYPKAMLRARVISDGIRMTMPEIISGIYTPEEVADFKKSPMPMENKIIDLDEVKKVKPEEEKSVELSTAIFDIVSVKKFADGRLEAFLVGGEIWTVDTEELARNLRALAPGKVEVIFDAHVKRIVAIAPAPTIQ